MGLMAFFYINPPSYCYGSDDSNATRQLMRAHERYNEFVRAPTESECAGTDDDAVYAHVRSGDIFRRRHYSLWAYQQPPLSFFTNAWVHSNRTTLVLIAEDRLNPAVKALEQLPNVRASISDDVNAHRRLLGCASSLILSNSNFGMMSFRTNKRVKDLYTWNWKHDAIYSQVAERELVNGRCDTRVHVIGTPKDGMSPRKKWNGPSNETNALLLHEKTLYERTLELPCL